MTPEQKKRRGRKPNAPRSYIAVVNELVRYIDNHPALTRRSTALKAGLMEHTITHWSNGKTNPHLLQFSYAAEAAGFELKLVPKSLL